MANFDIAYKKTGGWEGFYSNDPNDTGGETIYGVSRKNNPGWLGWRIVDNYKKLPGFPANMKKDTQLPGLAKELAKNKYWDVLRLTEINNQYLANRLYDISYNKGQGVALRFMADLTLTNSKTVTNEMIKLLNDEKRIINRIV